MLTDITLGQYYPGSSVIHGLDPRAKILATLLFITAIFFSLQLKILYPFPGTPLE